MEVRAELAHGLRVPRRGDWPQRSVQAVEDPRGRQRRRGPAREAANLDLSFLFTSSGEAGSSSAPPDERDDGRMLDDEILEDADVQKCIETEGTHVAKEIINTDRCASARVSVRLAAKCGPRVRGSLTMGLRFRGPSFGAFTVGGVSVARRQANDYVCKSTERRRGGDHAP